MDVRMEGDCAVVQLTTDEAVVLSEWLQHADAHGADESVTTAIATRLAETLGEHLGDQYPVTLEAARARLNPAD